MKFIKILFIIALSCCIKNLNAKTDTLSDSAKISLLTNTPWNGAVYALFGHTGIRVQDPTNHLDIVFNYGLFDFDSPNFFYRFAKGETDYSVGYTSTKNYIFGYQLRGIGITEQILNLSATESRKIFEALMLNCQPENRIYRYNYFFDNCSTRPRDIIEKNIEGTIIYTKTDNIQTYRDLVHECVNSQPWVRFGIDLIIGAEADKTITDRQKDFLPEYLMNAYSEAKIENPDGTFRNLVLSEQDLLIQTENLQFDNINSPLIAGLVLFTVCILISYMNYKKRFSVLGKIFDLLIFFSAGIAGIIIFFLMFFSEHPCTNPNWNIVWLNPIQFIFAILFSIKFFTKAAHCYHFINFASLTIFLLAWFLIPQSLESAFIPYIATLIVRSGVNIYMHKNKNKVL